MNNLPAVSVATGIKNLLSFILLFGVICPAIAFLMFFVSGKNYGLIAWACFIAGHTVSSIFNEYRKHYT